MFYLSMSQEPGCAHKQMFTQQHVMLLANIQVTSSSLQVKLKA